MQMSGETPLLKADPINPAWITDGAPVARAAVLTESADGRMRSGIWDCTAGRFEWHFAFDETVQILEGLKPAYELHHQVTYEKDALRSAAELASKYLRDRFLPEGGSDHQPRG